MPQITVAIDGPAGAGKSTVAKLVAKSLHYTFIDSGAMYRCVALESRAKGIAVDNVDGLETIARTIKIQFGSGPDGAQIVLSNGTDVSSAIRTQDISSLVSPVSAVPGVRKYMTSQQQSMGSSGGVVMEGRDIGTVVFPDAEVKIYLTASPEERARRRYEELLAKGTETTFESVLKDQLERDHRDSTRAEAPLKPAEDSITILTDGLTINDVVDNICEIARQKGA